MKNHFREIIKTESALPPWPRMILCACATGFPLLYGIYHGSATFSIYGALIGYLLSLNDHLGELKHRLGVTTLTFILLLTGYVMGYFLRGHDLLFDLTLAAIVYWIGVLGGEGAELERGVLFSTLGVVLVFYAPEIPPAIIPMILFYCGLGFASLVVSIPILSLIQKHKPEPFIRLRTSLHLTLTKKQEKHVHAACYTITTLASLAVVEYLQIERGYWITMTVLLVMRAERTQSVYKTLQRLFGTALGVLVCDIVGQFIQTPSFFVAGIILTAFIVPYALKKNYLWASFFTTVLVVFLIELAAAKFADLKTPFLRLQATLIGCLLSLLGTALSKILSHMLQKNKPQPVT